MSTTPAQYVRFVVEHVHGDSGVPEGLFSRAYRLRDDADTPWYDRDRLAEILDWFDDSLEEPLRFNRTRSKGVYRRTTKGVSWFKATAAEHIEKMHDLAAILTEHGHTVHEVRTDRPGYIVHEDRHQIVAEPFADTPRV